MVVTSLVNSFNPVPKVKTIKKTKVTKIVGKKHTETKSKEISSKVKARVWERDNHCCIFCNVNVPMFYANAHFIPRSAGGLGVEENVFTACEDCHREQDNGHNTKEYDQKAKRHLQGIYGKDWKIENLIYKKY